MSKYNAKDDIKYIRNLTINGASVKKVAEEFDKYLLHSNVSDSYKKSKKNRITLSQDVLKYLGLEVNIKSLTGNLKSFIVLNSDRNGILYFDDRMSEEYLNFSLARIIGKYIYNENDSIMTESYLELNNYSNVRLSKFASNFLMLEKDFIRSYVLHGKNNYYLANKYGVPVEAVKVRVRELGLA